MQKKNNVFACEHEAITVEQFRASLADAPCYTSNEKLDLLDFYVAKALIKTCKLGGSLSDYDWKGKQLGKLEKSFVDICSLDGRFLIARTDKMPKTVARFGLNTGSAICIDCPRGVMATECQVVEGVVRQKGNSTRVEIILTHIRNAIAHGNTFFFENGHCLLIDKNRGGDVSGALLIPSRSLIDFMVHIKAGPGAE